VDSIELSAYNSLFNKNYAMKEGGVIYIQETTTILIKIKIYNSVFSDNYSQEGGCIYSQVPTTQDSTVELVDNQFTFNPSMSAVITAVEDISSNIDTTEFLDSSSSYATAFVTFIGYSKILLQTNTFTTMISKASIYNDIAASVLR